MSVGRIVIPNTHRQFIERFPDDEACARFLEQLRWPDGFCCPVCQIAGTPWRQTRGRLVCATCHHEASVTANTIFEKTRTPLTAWFDAAWHLTTAKSGLSAKTMERTLGIRYRTAWVMLQRFRVAMVRSEREFLSGLVEVDETLIGGSKQGGKRGRGTSKSIVAIAIEIKDPKGYGRIRMRHIKDASGASLIPFVCDTVAKGSTIHTDGWTGYNDLANRGFDHQRTIVSTSEMPAHESMPGVHCIASLLKRWILGTHQGAVDTEHLQSYLEEFTFRFNRRTSRSRGLVFLRLLQQSVATKPITEADVTFGYQW
jgi:transposase-like protein